MKKYFDRSQADYDEELTVDRQGGQVGSAPLNRRNGSRSSAEKELRAVLRDLAILNARIPLK